MTADEPGTTGGARPTDRPNRNPEGGPKPGILARILWGVVAGPAWLVNKMLGNVR